MCFMFQMFHRGLWTPPIPFMCCRRVRRNVLSLKHLKHETPTFRDRCDPTEKEGARHGAAHTGLG